MHYQFNNKALKDFFKDNTKNILDSIKIKGIFKGFLMNVIDDRKAKFTVVYNKECDTYNVWYGNIPLIPRFKEFTTEDLDPKVIEDLKSTQVFLSQDDKLYINKYHFNIAELPDNNKGYVAYYGVTYEFYSHLNNCLYFIDAQDLNFVEEE